MIEGTSDNDFSNENLMHWASLDRVGEFPAIEKSQRQVSCHYSESKLWIP